MERRPETAWAFLQAGWMRAGWEDVACVIRLAVLPHGRGHADGCRRTIVAADAHIRPIVAADHDRFFGGSGGSPLPETLRDGRRFDPGLQ